MPATTIRCLLLLPLAFFHTSTYAATTYEQEQLSLVQEQLETIERLATQAQTASTTEPNERYRFDYPRLSQDIQSISQGVEGYLFPSRVQPRDSTELVRDYRLDNPPRGRCHEHE